MTVRPLAPPLLILRDIQLTFGGKPLFEGAELSVSAGDRLCLVGRNGSGKSTLMKIATGEIEPDDGERFVQPGSTVRYLPQEPDLDGFDTTLDHVLAGLEEGDDPQPARRLLDRLGLTGSEDPASLSGGEARRCALARVLAPQPDILLMDEPTNHLDMESIEALNLALENYEGTLIFVSHDREFVSSLATRVIDIKDKRLNDFQGTYEEYLSTLAV